MKQSRQERRRWAFEAALVRVNEEYRILPGKNASQDAPDQYDLVRRDRRRLARLRLRYGGAK